MEFRIGNQLRPFQGRETRILVPGLPKNVYGKNTGTNDFLIFLENPRDAAMQKLIWCTVENVEDLS